eukprot:2218035-Amphidinium_carterae.1
MLSCLTCKLRCNYPPHESRAPGETSSHDTMTRSGHWQFKGKTADTTAVNIAPPQICPCTGSVEPGVPLGGADDVHA